MKRHEILGRELFETRDWTIEHIHTDKLAARLATPNSNSQQFIRELDISRHLWFAAMEHLGYGPIPDAVNQLNRGVDRSIEYFFGDWWQQNEDDRICLDKSRDDRALIWSEPFIRSMVLCALTQRWQDASKICSWLDESVQLEYRFELNDYGFQLLYLCIASQLRPEPLPNVDKIADAIRGTRPKRPKLLFSLWEAALEGNEKRFTRDLRRSVKHRLSDSEVKRAVPNILYWIGIEESFIWHIAERNGVAFPDVAPEVEASVVRRQTAGLIVA
ncbi:MAG: hypothetical protein JW888_18635 [Pirellulales bacterium]|nr:hypothetical protein [Pirellulales bacterium]